MKILANSFGVTLYILCTVYEWHRYFIETDCFNKGGRLAVCILYTTPLALAAIAILWTIIEGLAKKCVLHLFS